MAEKSFIEEALEESYELFIEFHGRAATIVNGETRRDIVCIFSDDDLNYQGAHYDSDSGNQVTDVNFYVHIKREDISFINDDTEFEISGMKFKENIYSSKAYDGVPLFQGRLDVYNLKRIA